MTKVLRFAKPPRKIWLPLIGIASTVLVIATTVKTKSLNFIGDFETKDFSGWKTFVANIQVKSSIRPTSNL